MQEARSVCRCFTLQQDGMADRRDLDTATKHAVRAFTGSLMVRTYHAAFFPHVLMSLQRELVNTPIRVSEVQPGKEAFLQSNNEAD